MPRIRKDTCPKCKTINPDGWDVCCECGQPAPGAAACPNKGGGHPFMLALSRKEVDHLLHCLKLAVWFNVLPPGEVPDTFWRRQVGLKRKLKEVVN